jgi:hypothetical protein
MLGIMLSGFQWGNLKGKRPLCRPRYGRDDNIKMYLKGIVWDIMDWIYLALDRPTSVKAVLHFRVQKIWGTSWFS